MVSPILGGQSTAPLKLGKTTQAPLPAAPAGTTHAGSNCAGQAGTASSDSPQASKDVQPPAQQQRVKLIGLIIKLLETLISQNGGNTPQKNSFADSLPLHGQQAKSLSPQAQPVASPQGQDSSAPAPQTSTPSSAMASPTAPAAAPPGKANYDQAVLDEVNKFRAENGKAPVKLESHLNTAAQGHSDYQAQKNIMTHDGQNGSSPQDRVTGTGYNARLVSENVADGYKTPADVVKGWIDSPPHRENLLRSEVTEIGVGFNNDKWTLNLAQPG